MGGLIPPSGPPPWPICQRAGDVDGVPPEQVPSLNPKFEGSVLIDLNGVQFHALHELLLGDLRRLPVLLRLLSPVVGQVKQLFRGQGPHPLVPLLLTLHQGVKMRQTVRPVFVPVEVQAGGLAQPLRLSLKPAHRAVQGKGAQTVLPERIQAFSAPPGWPSGPDQSPAPAGPVRGASGHPLTPAP